MTLPAKLAETQQPVCANSKQCVGIDFEGEDTIDKGKGFVYVLGLPAQEVQRDKQGKDRRVDKKERAAEVKRGLDVEISAHGGNGFKGKAKSDLEKTIGKGERETEGDRRLNMGIIFDGGLEQESGLEEGSDTIGDVTQLLSEEPTRVILIK